MPRGRLEGKDCGIVVEVVAFVGFVELVRIGYFGAGFVVAAFAAEPARWGDMF